MITSPRGSYAAHAHPSRYDRGPTPGHTLDGFHDTPERVGWGWWAWLAVCLGTLALTMAVHHVR